MSLGICLPLRDHYHHHLFIHSLCNSNLYCCPMCSSHPSLSTPSPSLSFCSIPTSTTNACFPPRLQESTTHTHIYSCCHFPPTIDGLPTSPLTSPHNMNSVSWPGYKTSYSEHSSRPTWPPTNQSSPPSPKHSQSSCAAQSWSRPIPSAPS